MQSLISFHNIKIPGLQSPCLLSSLFTDYRGPVACQALLLVLDFMEITSNNNSNEKGEDHSLWNPH